MWVEVKKAHSLMMAEMWKELFEGEGIPTRLLPATGEPVDRRRIELEGALRQVGTYELVVRLARDIAPSVIVTVEAEPPSPATEPGEQE